MRRVITIKASDTVDLEIVARVKTHGNLTSEEVQRIVDGLTEQLMLSVTSLPYNAIPLGRIRVK